MSRKDEPQIVKIVIENTQLRKEVEVARKNLAELETGNENMNDYIIVLQRVVYAIKPVTTDEQDRDRFQTQLF